MHHLHWLESLGNVDQQVEQGEFVKVFSKVRAIYKRKIKGFRIKDEKIMREQMKDMINYQDFTMLQ